MKTAKILLVEDDQDDYEFFVMSLKHIAQFQFTLVWKQNGVEAMKYLKEDVTEFDLIVLDLNMPLKDGFQVLSEIRNIQGLAKVPVHVFTTAPLHAEKCAQLDCTGYFRKPVTMNGYREVVKAMLSEVYFFKQESDVRSNDK